ncbi:NERD domain-containing protein [Pelagibacteraceae bacterium]|nr:NERD domain-containing protein [Pelagibacteraceae bacterium]
MIKFFPDDLIQKDFKSPGEYELYKKLKEFGSLRNWIIYHSQSVHSHVSQHMGEIDFIIVIPKLGVITVEVKAVKSISYDPEVKLSWKLGSNKPESRGPFDQAFDNNRSLRNFLIEYYKTLNDVMFCSVVIFTEINFTTEKNIAWNRWEYINRNQLENKNGEDFLKEVESVIIQSREYNKYKIPFKNNSPDFNQIELIKKIRKKIEIFQDPNTRKNLNEKDLQKIFNETQLSTLNLLNRNRKCVVEGPAGTGKTLLAIELLKTKILQGEKTILLCFNKFFADYLSKIIISIKEEYGYDQNDDVVFCSTIDSFYKNLLNDKSRDIRNLRPKLVEKLFNNEIKENKLRNYENLIIDEFQDILSEEDIQILDLFFSKGLKGISFYFFGDFYYQNIQNFKDKYSINDFQKEYPSSIIPLDQNCRNFPEVIDYSERLCGFNPYIKYLREDQKNKHKTIKYSNNFDQLIKINTLLDELSKEKFLNSDIVVLSMKKLSDSCLKYTYYVSKDFSHVGSDSDDEYLKKFNKNMRDISNKEHELFYKKELELFRNYDDKLELKFLKNLKDMSVLNKKDYIYFTSIRKFKGLETDIVIIVDLDNISDENNKMILHTGLTRSKNKVFVFMNEKLKT